MTAPVLCVGHAAFDIAMQLDRHPRKDEKMRARAMELGGGGPAANAAVAVARLGGRASFCGYLGRDVFGDLHLRELEKEGVDTTFIVRGDEPTPLSLVLSKRDGTRAVVNYRSRSSFLGADAVATDTVEAACMLFDGHEPSLSLALLEIARRRRIPTVLDAGSVHEGTRALAMEVDCLAASATFAREFCRTRDVQRALADLSSRHPCVIITQGSQGLIWAQRGEKGRLPAFPVPVVDSTGAGDAFHGALALGMARGMEWTELLRFAAAVAALVCTGLGARAPLPHLAAMNDLLHATETSR